MTELLPVLLLGFVAVAFAGGSIGVSNLVGPRRPNPTKLGAYESENEPLLEEFFMSRGKTEARPWIRRLAHRVLPETLRHSMGIAYYTARSAGAAVRRDALNIGTYGRVAPRYGERVWIDPRSCDRITGGLGRNRTGEVLSGDWDLEAAPLGTSVKIQACEAHWTRGVPWEETGIYEHMIQVISECGEADGCRTLADVVTRYRRLDAMFQQILLEGQLRSRVELQAGGFRAVGEIYVHIDRNGQTLFGAGGNHRLAASRIAGLSCVPAQLGVVHAEALNRWPTNVTRSAQRPPECVGR